MPGLVMCGLVLRLAHLGEPEVDDLHEVAPRTHRLEDDVLGLEVAVDDPEVVRFAERGQRLPQNVHNATERERPLFVGDARQVPAAQELHDEVELAVLRLAEVDDGDGVRVVQAAGGARLGDEAGRGVLFTDEVGVDDLHGDRTPEVRLLGAVDAPHPPDPDELEDDVAAREGPSDERIVRVGRDFADGKAARRAELVLVVAVVCALRAGAHQRDQKRTTANSRSIRRPARQEGRPRTERARRALLRAFPWSATTRTMRTTLARARIGELLVEARVITQAQLDAALVSPRHEGQKIGQLLVELGMVNEDQLTQTLSHQLSVPWVSLYHIDFSRAAAQPRAAGCGGTVLRGAHLPPQREAEGDALRRDG